MAERFAAVRKPVVTIKVELPAMTTAQAYAKGLKIAEAIKEEDGARVKAVGVTT